MAGQQPTSGDSREDAAARAGAAVAAIWAVAEAAILAALAEAAARAVTGATLANIAARRLRQAITGILHRAEAQTRPVLAQEARDVRADAARVIAEDLVGLPGTAGPATGGRLAESLAHRVTSEVLGTPPPAEWRSLAAVLHNAGLNALRDADDVYRQVVAEAMRYHTGTGEAVRGLEGAERSARSLSRLQVAQKALDEFARRGITGYTDAAGRNWDLTSYVEMATRTAASRMHLALQLGTMGPAGLDLVIVDNPTRLAPCRVCRPFEGKVLSVTGAHPPGAEVSATSADGRRHTTRVLMSVAESRAAGLWHPNCRHSMTPFTDGAGFLPLAGGDERGYVEHSRSVSSPLPIGTLADYDAEQKLRAHERAIRRERRLLAAARTPQARGRARRRVAGATGRLEGHLQQHPRLLRNRRRERIDLAR